jgi:hypothetical protein
MDHRCPLCGSPLTGRKLSQPIIARAEIDCPFCKGRLKVNLHPAEEAVVLATLAGFLLLAGLGYALGREGLYVLAFAVAMLGAGALPVLERFWLRAWPRYLPKEDPST